MDKKTSLAPIETLEEYLSRGGQIKKCGPIEFKKAKSWSEISKEKRQAPVKNFSVTKKKSDL
jgi:hypothetical protein